MNSTEKHQKESLSIKRTKILATIGPATSSYLMIRELIDAGVNGFRLNFSHGTDAERIQQVAWIRRASKAANTPVAIVQDLHGPKIQLGNFEGEIPIDKGDKLRFKLNADYEKTGILPVQYDISKRVSKGEQLLIADGKIRTVISGVRAGVVTAVVENKGVLTKGRGINLPQTNFVGDTLTAKDRRDIRFGSTMDFDYVAQSFVQSQEDIIALRKMLKTLGSDAKIIAKIETKSATENIEDIIKEADGVMVARGDLASETMPELVPTITKKIVDLALEYKKLSIVATQMLASMTQSPEPTRAEVSDVATATVIGADCVMLSEETAIGKYPIETVSIMQRIIIYTQQNAPSQTVFYRDQDSTVGAAVTSAVTTLAHQVGAAAIVAETASGETARSIAARRPTMPIIMVSHNPRVVNQLALVYGGRSYLRPAEHKAAIKLTNWLRKRQRFNKGDIVVTASGMYPGEASATDTVKVRVLN